MKTILTVAAAICIVYLLLIAFYAVMQRSLIYYPTALSSEQAKQHAKVLGGAPWLSRDGHWLGWKTEGATASSVANRPRALVFHGNAGMALNRDYYADLLSGFRASGPWEVYVFEYPGYGPREGSPGEAAFSAAAVQATDELLEQNTSPLLIIGESIGSGVATELVRRRPDAVRALMLITPFDSLANVARHHMPYLPVGLLLRDRYDNLAALRNYQNPLIVVTAGQDTIVPTTLAAPLLEQHQGPALHETQIHAGHNGLHFEPARSPWPEVDRFLLINRD